MDFDARPSTLAYMARAFYPSPGLRRAGRFPPLRAAWRRHRVEPHRLTQFLQLTGLHAEKDLPLLYPLVFGFPLQMVILTHSAFPLPIWGALQIRNHVVQHRSVSAGSVLELETRVAGQRILDKGAEVDLHTAIRSRDDLVWETLNTFYYRGRFGAAGAASPLARSPEPGDAVVAQWFMPAGRGWRFAGLTGDYNGIHWVRWYARLFGFRRDFHHPQLALGQCMGHLDVPDPALPQRLDAWLKGPVYYESSVRLCATAEPHGVTFALVPDGEARPAIIGRWRSGAAVGPLLAEEDGSA
jgi:hypothetical protein